MALPDEVLDSVPSLEENEAVIERGEQTFIEVGNALMTIRIERQFLDAGYETFEDYVTQRWAMSRDYADLHISAARITTMVVKHGLPAPPTERAARPLVRRMNDAGAVNSKTGELRDPEAGERAVIEAWREVVESHDPGPDPEKPRPITSRDVSKVVNPPAGGGGTVSWFEGLGKVGDYLVSAEKAMGKFETLIGEKKPTDHIAEKAAKYAAWSEALAERLRVIERR